MSTPYVDSLEGNELEFLEKELARLVALENDLAKSKSVCQEKVEEECNKVLDAVRDKVNEHEQADKSLVTLQSKLSQSQAIVDELERTVKRLQNEAERARK
jgi:archaellum component FlaC